MALKITCPHCGHPHRLGQPYPVPGTELQCPCGRVLSVSYPKGMMDRLRGHGAAFSDPSATGPHSVAPPEDIAPPPTVQVRRGTGHTVPQKGRTPEPERTESFERTPMMDDAPKHRKPAAPTPYLPPPPPAPTPANTPPAGAPDYTQAKTEHSPVKADPPAPRAAPPTPVAPPRATPPPSGPKPVRRPPRAPTARTPRSLYSKLLRRGGLIALFCAVLGSGSLAGVFWYFSGDLPTVEALGEYEPPTVTIVYDAKGRLLGEIYEKRRYVVPLERIPEHVQNAFIASEDANFWTHDGIDLGGIFRAVFRNLAKGKKAQGASTITQQVARNFLLTREKTFIRKIREIILAQRVEKAFEKEHILYLYLNQIYLGSGAYGVEAASQIYFGKSVGDITLGESAILAGLPQRPSDYSPHRHWKKARARQVYVLTQMHSKEFIDKATFEAALAQPINIEPRTDDFLQKSPYFTEHIRRYLVDTYGFDKIYNDGLSVDSTCDLDLQRAAQDALTNGVTTASHRRGWRGAPEHLEEEAIDTRLQSVETALREAESVASLRVGSTNPDLPNAGGFAAVPERSTLMEGLESDGIVLDVQRDHALIGVGAHKAIVPLAWSKWAYPIDVERSWKYRAQNSMGNFLTRGDVVPIQVVNPDAQGDEDTKRIADTYKGSVAAVKLLQPPNLQGALLSYRLDTGAVQAMVGGVDFEDSEYNRATQAQRQVGSTFKPIVYASAIGSRLFTAASMLQDAPTVIGGGGGTLWKPSNYGGKYLGNITLRRALAMSRNVCTVRVLDALGPDAVYELAGPKLRIGYPKLKCSRTHIPIDGECSGTQEPSPVEGMIWCKSCDPKSCPEVRVDELFEAECLDEPWSDNGAKWCHSCDINLRVCDWYKEKNISSALNCNGARKDKDDDAVCRACDLSMGLGSSSLTMVELARAYSVFGTYGDLVDPYWIERVVDRDGTVIEAHEAPKAWPTAMDKATAGVAHWLLRGVATGGTAARTNKLGFQVAGKTGTTNDFRDAWFVGYNPDIVTAVWVGFDRPANMGQTFTGGQTALPIWMEYMTEAVPRESAPRFDELTKIVWADIDETTGLVAEGGRSMPFLPGTVPSSGMGAVGQVTAQDLLTSDF